MKTVISILIIVAVCLVLSGCLLAAAGVGAETAYVATQEDRSAGETLEDQRITTEVKTKLLADQMVSGFDINVDTHKSVVTLRGVVGSAVEKEQALEIARTTSGVDHVISKLFIDG